MQLTSEERARQTNSLRQRLEPENKLMDEKQIIASIKTLRKQYYTFIGYESFAGQSNTEGYKQKKQQKSKLTVAALLLQLK